MNASPKITWHDYGAKHRAATKKSKKARNTDAAPDAMLSRPECGVLGIGSPKPAEVANRALRECLGESPSFI